MVRYALLSVTNKSGLIAFAQGLVEYGYALLSTGGTATHLREAGLPVTDVASMTGSPEILSGRVKTLHPKVHGGILFDRDNPQHVKEAAAHNIWPIDLVVVNLYAFASEAKAKDLPLHQAIEHIDVGGPTMLRAAAKNFRHVLPVISPDDYPRIIHALKQGDLPHSLRAELAGKTFAQVSAYDAMIADSFLASTTEPLVKGVAPDLPEALNLPLKRLTSLRYGENPHQRAGLYAWEASEPTGFAAVTILQGKELSYNNLLDLDAATSLVGDFAEPAVAIVKHTNPCGVALGSDASPAMAALFARALAADPKSAFGGIVAVNRPVDKEAAQKMAEIFLECIAAPAFSPEALEVLKPKKNLRLVTGDFRPPSRASNQSALSLRSIAGALLIQDQDLALNASSQWRIVSKRPPTPRETADLAFAATVVKHVKSNAIVYARDLVTVATGAGQMSRVDSTMFAAKKAQEQGLSLGHCSVASDAFFPFRDSIDFLASVGVRAVIQPGGSMRDGESIAAADAAGIAMVFTGERHFRH